MSIRDKLEALMWLWILGIVIMAEFVLSAIAFPFVLVAKFLGSIMERA